MGTLYGSAVVPRSPDRDTGTDLLCHGLPTVAPGLTEGLLKLRETFGPIGWHGRETMPQPCAPRAPLDCVPLTRSAADHGHLPPVPSTHSPLAPAPPLAHQPAARRASHSCDPHCPERSRA